MLIDEVWIIEGLINEKVVLKEVFTDEKEAKARYKTICSENKIKYQTPWLCMRLYESIELYRQNSDTGEILERKVRTFR